MAAATQEQVRLAIERSNASGTAAEVLAIITAKSIEETDSTPVTASTLETRIDPQMAIAMIEKFGAVKGSSARLEAQFYQFATVGLDMSAQPRRDAIDQLVLAGVFTADEGAALKGLGRWQESPLEAYGGERGLTTDEATVQSVLDEITAEQQAAAAAVARRELEIQVRTWLDSQYNRALAAMDAGATTFEDLVPVLTSIE